MKASIQDTLMYSAILKPIAEEHKIDPNSLEILVIPERNEFKKANTHIQIKLEHFSKTLRFNLLSNKENDNAVKEISEKFVQHLSSPEFLLEDPYLNFYVQTGFLFCFFKVLRTHRGNSSLLDLNEVFKEFEKLGIHKLYVSDANLDETNYTLELEGKLYFLGDGLVFTDGLADLITYLSLNENKDFSLSDREPDNPEDPPILILNVHASTKYTDGIISRKNIFHDSDFILGPPEIAITHVVFNYVDSLFKIKENEQYLALRDLLVLKIDFTDKAWLAPV
jgi:hypothetical protein